MTQYYHTTEAATAHLESVGLTFEGFKAWTVTENATLKITEGYELAYPAKLVSQYIRSHNTL